MIYLLLTKFVAITTKLDLDFIPKVWKCVTECQAQLSEASRVLCPPAHWVSGSGSPPGVVVLFLNPG